MPLILHERTASLAIIRLNRPEKLNSLSHEMFAELSLLLRQLESETELRAVILTGAGDKAFCAGTDIVELSTNDETSAAVTSKRGQNLCDQIESFTVPVIAAINGAAAGGGCELALSCHVRFASESAVFSLPEMKLGLIPGYGGTQRLPREIGQGRALELMLTGRSLTAAEALDVGLVNQVVSGDVVSAAVSFAEQLERLSPLSIRACLKAVTEGMKMSLEDGLALETELFSSLFATADAKEGTTAFLEKRRPVFKGK
jgi:enoyl-CoA hydratase